MAIKSAYELAMERLGKSGGPKLTDPQKAKLAELDRVYTAKIAEEALAEHPEIAAARAAGDAEKTAKLQEHLRNAIQKLRDQLEQKKEAVRKSG
jgi:DNA-binding GntR family transcriptional regulator